ncbi:ctr copper transporter family protein [Hirsutella rhossiliensis]|uniref:Copper transport protein n=1 Tax=Hirsutella rhossiliensis TaxID=111463 RepID=A0A9P8MVB7_9HYPO|nr:ctr copper transporter family domain-containing protein [Hirsutella rhossiliensis]KAH0961824.1 ctr copper transporter family domain-containing protein [Hirsutella rhossiliensis]
MSMSMATSSEAMNMAMTTGTQNMAMPSSTGASGMGDMSGHGMSGMMSMADMMMVFFTSFQTPLYSTAWTPTTQGEYAGTCIFLIALACILRFMLALRPILEARFWRNGHLFHPNGDPLLEALDEQKTPGRRLQTVRHDIAGQWSGWRASAAAARATFEVLIAGVGYLLMLAVMTMNVGYLLSVLGGVWLGTFLLGGLASGR